MAGSSWIFLFRLSLIVAQGVSAYKVGGQVNSQCSFLNDELKKGHEVGLNAISLIHFQYDPLYERPRTPRLSILNGLSYKVVISDCIYGSTKYLAQRRGQMPEIMGQQPDYSEEPSLLSIQSSISSNGSFTLWVNPPIESGEPKWSLVMASVAGHRKELKQQWDGSPMEIFVAESGLIIFILLNSNGEIFDYQKAISIR